MAQGELVEERVGIVDDHAGRRERRAIVAANLQPRHPLDAVAVVPLETIDGDLKDLKTAFRSVAVERLGVRVEDHALAGLDAVHKLAGRAVGRDVAVGVALDVGLGLLAEGVVVNIADAGANGDGHGAVIAAVDDARLVAAVVENHDVLQPIDLFRRPQNRLAQDVVPIGRVVPALRHAADGDAGVLEHLHPLGDVARRDLHRLGDQPAVFARQPGHQPFVLDVPRDVVGDDFRRDREAGLVERLDHLDPLEPLLRGVAGKLAQRAVDRRDAADARHDGELALDAHPLGPLAELDVEGGGDFAADGVILGRAVVDEGGRIVDEHAHGNPPGNRLFIGRQCESRYEKEQGGKQTAPIELVHGWVPRWWSGSRATDPVWQTAMAGVGVTW